MYKKTTTTEVKYKTKGATMIRLWMEMSTCSRVDVFGSQPGPDQVPSRDRHTFPQLYRLGLKRMVPPPVG